VRKTDTGADVNGNPTSHPANSGPKRRPRIVALAMSVGERISFRKRTVPVVSW